MKIVTVYTAANTLDEAARKIDEGDWFAERSDAEDATSSGTLKHVFTAEVEIQRMSVSG